MKLKRKTGCLLLAVVAFAETTALQVGPFVSTAQAVVGRPLTPVSYAGVARRTSRRTTRRNVDYNNNPGVW